MTATTAHHPRRQCAGERDRRPKIDLDHPVDLVLAQLGENSAGGQGGVGHEHVDLASLCDQLLDRRPRGQIAGERSPTQLLGQRLEHVGPAAGHHQLGAARRQRAGDRVADATGGTGEQDPSAEQGV